MLAACAAAGKRPVLYPNAKVAQVGDAQAQKDIDACIALAERSGAPAQNVGRAMGPAAEGAAIGAAAGAVGSVIRGGNVGESAAAGAAIGGTAGAVHGAFRAADPDPLHQRFVQRCLRDRGYDVIGWR
jgi:hypothetical protein